MNLFRIILKCTFIDGGQTISLARSRIQKCRCLLAQVHIYVAIQNNNSK